MNITIHSPEPKGIKRTHLHSHAIVLTIRITDAPTRDGVIRWLESFEFHGRPSVDDSDCAQCGNLAMDSVSLVVIEDVVIHGPCSRDAVINELRKIEYGHDGRFADGSAWNFPLHCMEISVDPPEPQESHYA